MNVLTFQQERGGRRLGLKGPRAAEWLEAQGVFLPGSANQWSAGDAGAGERAGRGTTGARTELLVARLGTSEFFLEEGAGGYRVSSIGAALAAPPPGVYPVLREDAAFSLSGAGAHEVLAQVCNVNFADLDPASHPVIMTLMIGVAVLVVPQAADGWPRLRIWCDPTFGHYLEESLGTVVAESGGNHRRST